MANQIALNLGAGHDDSAAQRTAMHLQRFWTPAMRRQLAEYRHGGGEVAPEVATALALLEPDQSNVRQTP
jgi:hypothetical protein